MSRRTRTAIAAALTGLAIGGALLTAPAQAGTTSTITLTSTGSLSIAEPTGTSAAPVNLGSTASGVSAWTTGALGTVTVTDGRTGLLANTWIASAAVSDFVLQSPPAGATAAQKTIPAAGMVYNMGSPTALSGSATAPVFAPVPAVMAAADSAAAVGSMTAVGTNGESWSPTLTVALTNQVAGTYVGTVVHSVA